ncbi:hypothetical protein JHK87_051132 [Glycine soja]|nr:hypothetical protein JHK87_051132 [Glycine soja]
MQHRKLTSGRPSGTDGSDYSYRMVVDSRYQLVAKGKKYLSLHFITEAAKSLISCSFSKMFIMRIEADAPNTVAYSSVIVSVVSLIIGNIGRRRSRSGLLRFYAVVSSIAMLLLIASLATQHLLLKVNMLSRILNFGEQGSLLLYVVTLSVLKLCTVKAVAFLLFNMVPPKKTS